MISTLKNVLRRLFAPASITLTFDYRGEIQDWWALEDALAEIPGAYDPGGDVMKRTLRIDYWPSKTTPEQVAAEVTRIAKEQGIVARVMKRTNDGAL